VKGCNKMVIEIQHRDLTSLKNQEDLEQTIVPPVVFNRTELIERLGGDTDLLAEVILLFLDDCPKRLAAIKNAVDLRDADLIRTTAHALKGAAGTLSARAVFEATQTLERLAAAGRLESVEAAWKTLAKEADTLMDTLRTMEGAAPGPPTQSLARPDR
jgi:HPt (histidine-containing phosphotransfer) domain-containing protein